MTDYFSKAPHLHDCKIGPHHDECTCGLAAARTEIEQLRKDYTELLGRNEALTFKLVDAEVEIERLVETSPALFGWAVVGISSLAFIFTFIYAQIYK